MDDKENRMPDEAQQATQPSPRPDETDVGARALGMALTTSFRILKLTMLVVAILFLCSGIFVIEKNEEGMILRFGKVVGTKADRILKSGLHWGWPFPIDRVVRIPTDVRTLRVSTFYTEQVEKLGYSAPTSLEPGIDGYCLTGDLNIIHCDLKVNYVVADTYDFFTRVSDAEDLIRAAVCNAVVSTVGRYSVDQVLRSSVQDVLSSIQDRAEQELDALECGLRISSIEFDRDIPPQRVRQAFDTVVQADQFRSATITRAEGEASAMLSEAAGTVGIELTAKINALIEAEEKATADVESLRHEVSELYKQAGGQVAVTIAQAETYKERVEREALADSEYLKQMLEKERLDLYLQTALLEVFENMLGSATETFVLSKDSEGELRVEMGSNPVVQKENLAILK